MAPPFSSTAPTASAPPADWSAGTGPADPRPDRTLGRRSAVPGGRALVGAALVVAAAVMTFAAYYMATAAATATYVVAARPLQANERIEAGDLTVVHADLPPEVAKHAFKDPKDLVGKVVLAPLAPNALVVSSVVRTEGDADSLEAYEVSFTAPAWKLGGDRLQPGELIDIVPTGDSRDPSRPAASPARDVKVIARQAADPTGFGAGAASADVIVTVAAADPAAYGNIVSAVRGEFAIVRSTRAPGVRAPATGTGGAPAAGPVWSVPPGTGAASGTTVKRP